MKIERWNRETDGELTETSFRRKIGKLGYRVTCYTYPPGTMFDVHTHPVDKIDGVLSGRFRIGMHGDSAVLEPGDFVHVPAETEHTAEVVGSEPVVSLDAVRTG